MIYIQWKLGEVFLEEVMFCVALMDRNDFDKHRRQMGLSGQNC